ncbi:MAG: RNA polymerase sigma factor [Bacteroidetes bacterium]|nr:RNA polymerase sigma factor [Bacteroidota bacterium]MCB9042883.1 RNA polymerase sigma factor [Chitinophagales bacterium]
MMRLCLRYTQNDETLALQLVNDGMLRVFKKIHLFQFKGSLEGWIRKLVYHTLCDYYKQENKYLKRMIFEENLPETSVADNTVNDLFYDDLIILIAQLPQKSQDVFRLFAIEGYSHAEIAAMLDISEGTSKWYLSEARKWLSEKIHSLNQNERYAG